MLTPKSFQYSITCLANSPTRIAKLIDVRLNFFPTTLARCVGFRYWRFDWTSPCLWSSLSVSVSCSDFIFFCIIITWNETTVTGTTSYKNLEWWVVVGKTNKERREPWLVVMGGGSRFKGCGFESRCRLQHGHDIFSYWSVVKIVMMFAWKDRK